MRRRHRAITKAECRGLRVPINVDVHIIGWLIKRNFVLLTNTFYIDRPPRLDTNLSQSVSTLFNDKMIVKRFESFDQDIVTMSNDLSPVLSTNPLVISFQ